MDLVGLGQQQLRHGEAECFGDLQVDDIYELYQREFEQLKPPKTLHVRLKAPPGIGSVQTRSGRHITIGQDRIVEASAEDADPLVRNGWTRLAEG